MVANSRGDVVGQMDPYGEFHCGDEVVWVILSTPVEVVVKAKPKKMKRARTEDGHYKADDKSTPYVNEAWE
jgi:hypothetical protein